MRKQIDVSTLGGRIKYKRTEAGMTQAAVAEALFTEHNVISEYESDEKNIPLDRLKKIAELLHTSVGYLVDGIENELSEEDRELLAALHAIKDGGLRRVAIEQVRLLGRV